MEFITSKINQYFPLIQTLRSYEKGLFKGDLIAGITVGILLIPQGMAYALIAGLPPEYGLYAALVPLIVYAFMGTSRHLSVGPAALVSLLVAAAVSPFAESPEDFIVLSIILGVMSGFIQLIFGLFKLGFLVNLVSNPVLSGFVSAAAIIIGFSQFHHLLGIEAVSGRLHEVIYGIIIQLSEIHIGALLMGLLSITVILFLKKKYSKFPGPMLVVIIGIITVYAAGLEQAGVPIVGDIKQGLPSFVIPVIDLNIIIQLFPMAIAIALVSFMEAVAIAKVIEQKEETDEVDSNQELIALGVSKIVGALFQSYPSSSSFSRTAVNYSSGGSTGVSSLITAMTVALALLFLTPVFYYLPNTILAAIIMISVVGLIDFKEAKNLWLLGHYDRYMLLATFAGTLFIGINEGIFLGVTLSVMMLLYRSARPRYSVMGKIPGTSIYRNVGRYKTEQIEEILIFRFDAPLHFANADYFKERIELLIEEKPKIKCLILDLNGVNDIDSTGLEILFQIIYQLKKDGIKVRLAEVKSSVRDMIKKSRGEELTPEFYMRIEDAVIATSETKDDAELDEYNIYRDTH